MSDFNEIGKQFVTHFYSIFNQPKENLIQLFSDQSMLSFEGEQFLGQNSIYEKLSSFGKVDHNVTTLDCQPTTNNGILAFVSG